MNKLFIEDSMKSELGEGVSKLAFMKQKAQCQLDIKDPSLQVGYFGR